MAGQSVAASRTTRLSVSDDDSSPPRNAGSFSSYQARIWAAVRPGRLEELGDRRLERPEAGQAGDHGIGCIDGHAQHAGPVGDEQVAGRDPQRPDVHRSAEPAHPHVVVRRHDPFA